MAIFFALGASQSAGQATSLANLLELVQNDRVAESEDYQARLQEFEQNAARQQQILDTTNQRITSEEQTQVELSDQFEANEISNSESTKWAMKLKFVNTFKKMRTTDPKSRFLFLKCLLKTNFGLT